MLAIADRPTSSPTTRELIRAATATPDTHDAQLSAARYELFRRALVSHDEQAWESLYQLYEALLASWIGKRVTVPLETYDALLSDSWMKFLRNIRTADKFAGFANLGAILAYLKCCVFSVCVDYVRAQNRDKQYLSLETVQEEDYEQIGMESDMLQRIHYQDLLRLISPFLRTEQERIIVQVLLVEQEKPSSILALYPDLFSSAEDIYWTRRRVVERLQRSRVLQAAKEAL